MRRIVLVGKPNCGKTTLFNRLTGRHERIANYAGVTVDIVSGRLSGFSDHEIVDLPGTYSLKGSAGEEKLAEDFLSKEKIDLIVIVVDAIHPERHISLVKELKALQLPMIVALNYIDEAQKRGIQVKERCLEEAFACPVIGISALKGTRLQELKRAMIGPVPVVREDPSEEKLKRCILQRPSEISRADRLLLHPKAAYFWMALVYGFVLVFSIGIGGNVFGTIVQRGTEAFLSQIEAALEGSVSPAFLSFVTDGLLSGLFNVLSLVPPIVFLFFFISLLEDSGYIARSAYLMDVPLRKIGLSGKAFVPLFLGFGCSVSAVLASRTLHDRKERIRAIWLIPFMSCPAKMMIYLFLGTVFFREKAWLFVLGMYLLGLCCFICAALMLKLRPIRLEETVMEIPPLRRPSLRNALFLAQDKLSDYVGRAFGILLVASVAVWFLDSFDFRMQYVGGEGTSMLAGFAEAFSFFLQPFGFPEGWKVLSSLICGLISKESVISVLLVLYGGTSGLQAGFSIPQVWAFSAFVLLYMPCAATFAVVRKELGALWKTVLFFFLLTAFAYGASWIVYQFALWIA